MFFLGQAIKDEDPSLKLWCWHPCLNLWRNLCWNSGMNLALQGSKAARSRGKVPSLHPDPKDAGFQGSSIYSRLYKGFQVFKLSGFQNSKAYHSRFFRVPWFQDLMTHEAALHIKQRKMQPNKPKFKLNPQILLRRPERLLENFLQGIPARSPAKGFCSGTVYPRTLKSWSFETIEICNLGLLEPCNLWTLEPCNLRILQP